MGKTFSYIQPEALKMPRKMFQTWPGWADKSFQGGTNFFSTVVEKFYPRIKVLGGKFFLDRTGPATAGPKFPEPTIKNIIPLFVIKQIRNFCITIACLYHFRRNKTLIFKQQLRYELGACKNNSRSLRMKLNNKLLRRFY